ncbi:MAG: aldo/keto reductase [Lentisphaeria bacterium]|jgi:aryl-alcohol dehydrogenase-like predicted oxidoreductase|nr:aldo/keto reductase [Lentisphaeria bacterium]
MSTDRRDFLRGIATGALALGAVPSLAQNAPAAAPAQKVQRRAFGKLGDEVSILGLGLGSAFTTPYDKDRETGQKLLLRAFELGVNFWDTARPYGPSEVMIAPALKGIRKQVFLSSKSGSRDYDGFLRDLETSLRNLQTDYLDLYLIHNLEPKKDTDLDQIGNGAVRAARKAKEQGLIRGFGMSGHTEPDILMAALRRWEPDALLTIFPASRPNNGRYEDELLPLARERNLGVMAMKALRRDRQSDLKGTDLVRYPMSLPGIHTTLVGLDSLEHLEMNAAMASQFTPLGQRQRAAISREVQQTLGSYPAPWNMPGYRDGMPA